MTGPTPTADDESLPPDTDFSLFEALATADLPERREAAMKRRILARVRAAGQPALTTIHADQATWESFLPGVSIEVLRRTSDGCVRRGRVRVPAAKRAMAVGRARGPAASRREAGPTDRMRG